MPARLLGSLQLPARPLLASHDALGRSRQSKAAVGAVAQAAVADLTPAQVVSQHEMQRPTAFAPVPLTSALPSSLLGDFDCYARAEHHLLDLVQSTDLDSQLRFDVDLEQSAQAVQSAVNSAVQQAFGASTDQAEERDSAQLFLQRTLYRINRMEVFWYDRLQTYNNERSLFLAQLRNSIEQPWQDWERQQMLCKDYEGLTAHEVKRALGQQYNHDVRPPLSEAAAYVQDAMTREGYRHLIALGSLEGLVEFSRQSRVCAGAANEIMCTVFRVLMEEYGTGRFSRKHSTFYSIMMRQLGLNTEPESYFNVVPWQALANCNHNYLVSGRRRHYLRNMGGLTFFEIAGPATYTTYLKAARRLQLPEDAAGYWELHIKEDERHGKQMLDDVALPLVDKYPHDSWELLLGYDQEKFMGDRAAKAIVDQLKKLQ